MLNVQGGNNIDARIAQNRDILVALLALGARRVGMSQLIDETNGGTTPFDRLHIHLFNDDASVRDAGTRNHLQSFEDRRRLSASVRLDEADDDILPVALASLRFVEHRVGLANAGERPR